MKRVAVGVCAVGAALCLSPADTPMGLAAPGVSAATAYESPLLGGSAPTAALLAILNETGAPTPSAAQGPGQDAAAIINAFIQGLSGGGAASGAGAATGSGASAVHNVSINHALLFPGATVPVAASLWSNALDSALEAWRNATSAVGGTLPNTINGSVGPKDIFNVYFSDLPTDSVTNVVWSKDKVTITMAADGYARWREFIDRYIVGGSSSGQPLVDGTLELRDKSNNVIRSIDFDGLTPDSLHPVPPTGPESILRFVVTFTRDSAATTTPASTPGGRANTTTTSGGRAATPKRPPTTPPSAPSTTTPSAPTSALTPGRVDAGVRGRSNFRVDIGSMPTDNVMRAEWTSDGDLTLTLPLSDLDEWQEWVQASTVSEQTGASSARDGSVTFLGPGMKTELGVVEFYGLQPVELTTDPSAPGAGHVRTFKVRLSSTDARTHTFETPPSDPPAKPASTTGSAVGDAASDIATTVSTAALTSIAIFPGGGAAPVGLQPGNRPMGAGLFGMTWDLQWASGNTLTTGASAPPVGGLEAVAFAGAAARLLDVCSADPADALCDVMFSSTEPNVWNLQENRMVFEGIHSSLLNDLTAQLGLGMAARVCTDSPATAACGVALQVFENLRDWAAACSIAGTSTACAGETTAATALGNELAATFAGLPAGALVIANDDTEIVRLPDQDDGLQAFAIRHPDGSVEVLLQGRDNSSARVPAQMSTDATGNTLYALPSGATITAPSAGVESVNLNGQPGLLASSLADIESIVDSVLNGDDTVADGEPAIAGIVVANGGSMGNDLFNATFLNRGKPVVGQSSGLVLEAADAVDFAPVAASGEAHLRHLRPIAAWTTGPRNGRSTASCGTTLSRPPVLAARQCSLPMKRAWNCLAYPAVSMTRFWCGSRPTAKSWPET